MAQSRLIWSSYVKPKTEYEEEGDRKLWNDYRELVSTWQTLLPPLQKPLCYYKNLWPAPLWDVLGIVAADRHFKARPTDILVATYPKSGTTWIKALLFATVHCRGTRQQREEAAQTLLGLNPHDCVPILESQVYMVDKAIPNLELVTIAPRLFHTHIPCPSLPASVASSECRLVYLWRDPKDVIVSCWHFFNGNWRKEGLDPLPIHYVIESFLEGPSVFGSIWDHVLDYWQYSLKCPERVLFLNYENMRQDTVATVRKLAEFIGKPFTAKEDDEGVANDIVQLCSIDSLRKTPVNQSGSTSFGNTQLQNSTFFRCGKAGDWVNSLSKDVATKIDKISEKTFKAAGITASFFN